MGTGTELILRWVAAVLSLAGLANALYFTLAYYGRVRKARWVPERFCARRDSSCVTVLQTPYASLLGVPNSLLGIAYYLLVVDWARTGRTLAWEWLDLTLTAVSVMTVAFGFYLIHALRWKLRTHCPLCYAAHAVNLALLVLIILLSRGASQ